MVEVEEIELDLGLSIGGVFRKPLEKPKPELGPDCLVSGSDPNNEVQKVFPQVNREVQALKRMELKRKREQKKGNGNRVGESEPEPECEQVFKKEKTELLDGAVSLTAPFFVLQPQQYGTVQYMPLNNGLSLPCWFASEKNVGGVDGVSFNGGNGKAKSNGSSRCSSSAVSDYQSSSREDGGCSDSHSHSANSFTEQTELKKSNEMNIKRNQAEEIASSHPTRAKQCSNSHDNTKHNNVNEAQTQPHIIQFQPNPMKLPMPINKPLLPTENSTKGVALFKDTKARPQMPYVSTKGNGPNGKTVNGFLYRYSKSDQVTIVCVCHGSTFSPAEFVQHAGGTDITHPLRHITVISNAFG